MNFKSAVLTNNNEKHSHINPSQQKINPENIPSSPVRNSITDVVMQSPSGRIYTDKISLPRSNQINTSDTQSDEDLVQQDLNIYESQLKSVKK